MAVGALELKFWEACCEVIGLPELKTRHWSLGQEIGGADAMQVKAILDDVFAKRTQQAWTEAFQSADCCVSPVLNTEEAVRHPQFVARELSSIARHPTEGDYVKTRASVLFSL